jgi:hypothetical protein
MKKLALIVLFFTASVYVFAQDSTRSEKKWAKDTVLLIHLPLDSDKQISYKIVKNVPGVSKAELYDRAKLWIAKAFRSAKNVTQLDDKEGGNLVIKAFVEHITPTEFFTEGYTYDLRFMIHFTVKDGRYRMIINSDAVDVMETKYVKAYSYSLLESYLLMLDWNKNARTGNMEYNRTNLFGKASARIRAAPINRFAELAESCISEVVGAMKVTTKGDDF